MSDLRRRDFITLLGGAGAGPLAARAQQGDPMRRLRVLQPAHRFDAFFQGLRDLGYANGQNSHRLPIHGGAWRDV